MVQLRDLDSRFWPPGSAGRRGDLVEDLNKFFHPFLPVGLEFSPRILALPTRRH